MGMLDAEEIAEEKQKEAEIEEELSKIIYVKNLNFDTKEPALQNLFEKAQVGTIRSVKIVKSNGNSQGYGFVEFSESDAAMKCLKKLQNSLLDGHSIQLSVSKQEKAELKKKGRKDKTEDIPISTKIVIRNLAFECTKKDVRELLKAYGEVKAIRLPKKMNGQHRYQPIDCCPLYSDYSNSFIIEVLRSPSFRAQKKQRTHSLHSKTHICTAESQLSNGLKQNETNKQTAYLSVTQL